MRFAAAALVAALLGSCATPQPQAEAPTPPLGALPAITEAPADARLLGVAAAEPVMLDDAAAERAVAAFRISCPTLIRRADASGLTRGEDWRAVCARAAALPGGQAAQFFAEDFEPVRVGDGAAFATGYFEPEIAGSREARPGYAPVYRKPADLVEADLGLFTDTLRGKRVRGRVEAGAFVPFHDRGAIEDGALGGKGLELAWAVDPIELFFLQIQGSGRLRMPDGQVMRIGYDGQNGRGYTAIGKLLRERGLLAPGQATMQGIIGWLRANPAQGRALMRENKSYIFFRELTGPGPLGALGLPVTPRATVAADPAFVPLGAPVVLTLDSAQASGIWVAQDTGGAIKGANRFDIFWGAGTEAASIAGKLSAKGSAVLLLPKGTLARLANDAPSPRP